MRHSELRELIADVFGERMGAVLVADQALGLLGDRTAQQALDAGVEPRAVWAALCEAMEVPAHERFGRRLPVGRAGRDTPGSG